MVTISCAVLEQVRKNHVAYAQMLAEGAKVQRGGTHGMFAYWQDVAKQVHLKELSVSEGLNRLHTLYSHFEDTKRNLEKQKLLYEQFVQYHKAYDDARLKFHDTRRRVQWQLTGDIRLTGLTPWAFKKKDVFHAYFCMEKSSLWQPELKYPLLQRYMAEHTIECKPSQLHVGVYFLDEASFEFKNYSSSEIRQAVLETTQIFESIHSEFSRRKAAIVKTK